MFEEFSRGYYLGRMYVTPRTDEPAAMAAAQHERVNEQLYATDEGLERLDRPLVMKVGTRHFPVQGDAGVPADTLALPESALSDTPVDNPPTLTEVLLAKADRAGQLLGLTGDGGPEPGGWGRSGEDGSPGPTGADGPAGI